MDRRRVRWIVSLRRLRERQERRRRALLSALAPRAGTGAPAAIARTTSLAVLLLLAPALRGCSSPQSSADPPRIDMSSDEAAARSIERVRDSLDEQQRRELTDATVLLVRHALGADRAAALDPDKARIAVKQVLDGRTAAEVIAEARAVESKGGPGFPGKSAAPGSGSAPASPGGDAGAP
jgi:hypothetical protein